MKRRIKLSTLLKRTVLAILAIVIVSVVLVYFVDKYNPTDNSYANKYDDSYWNQEVLSDFEYSEDIYARVNKYKWNNTKDYVAPWVADGLDEEQVTLKQRITYGRYKEEHEVITRVIVNLFKEYDALKKKQDVAKLWAEKTTDNSAKDWILSRFDYTEEEVLLQYEDKGAISEDIDDYDGVFKYVEYCGYNGSKVDLAEILKTKVTLEEVVTAIKENSSEEEFANFKEFDLLYLLLNDDDLYETVTDDDTIDAAEWILNRYGISEEVIERKYDSIGLMSENIDEFLSVFSYLEHCGFEGTYEEAVEILKTSERSNAILSGLKNNSDKSKFTNYKEFDLMYLLLLDSKIYNDICDFDYESYSALVSDYNYYYGLNEDVKSRQDTLLEWKAYYPTTLLGFGGLATDYPEKPALTVNKDNGNILEFWFNMYSTSFKLIEKTRSGEVVQTWLSNPEGDETANLKILNKQKSLINVSYSILKGQTGVYSTYEHSTSETNEYNDTLTPTYAVNVDAENNKIVVWYKIQKRGINYTNFPKYISAAKMEEYFKRNEQLVAEGAVTSTGEPVKLIKEDRTLYQQFCQVEGSFYTLIPAELTLSGQTVKNELNEFGYDYYEFNNTHDKMSGIERNVLFKCLYEYCGYTEDDLNSDNAEFDYQIDTSDPAYEIAIEYTLTENGLEATVPGNSIKEDPDYPLTYIDILPYFTATANGVEGYTVIPDGSGAILNHGNGKNYPKYQKRVYTTDLTNVSFVNTGSNDDLMFPMYSVINPVEGSGIVAYATSSGSQLQLTADVSGRTTSEFGNFNVNYFTAYLRESKVITVGTNSWERTQLTKWTNARVKDDITINYHLLNSDQLNYSAAAKQYRDILVDLYDLELNDKTLNPVLDMEVIGSYSFTDNFIGIPYTSKGTLTTYDQLQTIINTFEEKGVNNINAFYLGWRNEGLENTSFEKIKLSKKLGSKAKFEALLKSTSENVNIYPYVSFGELNKYQESFGKNHYTTHAVDGDLVKKQPYDLNSNVFDKTKDKIYILSPRYYVSFAEALAKSYSEVTNNYDYIAIDKMGSELSGDYRKGKETFKVDAVRNQITSLETLTNSGIKNITLYKPYEYAFKYVDNAKNIPYQATQYEILDYSVPFYQLVVNGLFDYSGESFNANSEKGMMEHLMRMIETGSNMSFTFSYESSEKLLQTDYNSYYYTMYTDWVETVEDVYSKLVELGIYGGELVSHECVSTNVYKVTYRTAKEDIVVYLNYTRNYYTADDGTVVPYKSYKLAE